MAITLDTIVNKVFKVVKNGYDNNEVEAFLDEILEEMENREAHTSELEAKVNALTHELEEARAQLAARPAAAASPVAPVKTVEDRRSSESFELVLSKAKNVYDEIVAAADARAEEIIASANEEAANIRVTAEGQISDLTEKLASLRKQSSEYYASVKKIVDAQNVTMDQLKKLL
ncbi:MAG: DivIVA domain-containing protein [Clostridia bacterium]|nr:DivIVA domain-containing protein [Clostridia bacterium]